jgi:peptidoglycan/xylan/chitin deacetylase (PgdA/CDA1 family)
MVRRIAYQSGWPIIKRLWCQTILKRGTVFILMYHKVGPNPSPYFGASVSPDTFEKQIHFFLKHYRIVALEELVNLHKFEGRKAIISITFDDGYQGVYRWAFPVLKKYNVPATIFLTTGFTDTHKIIWHDYLAWILYAAKKKFRANPTSLTGLPEEVAVPVKDILLSGDEDYLNIQLLREIALSLKYITDEGRGRIFDRLTELLAIEVPLEFERAMLSWDEIREMSRHNIYFGAHTKTHPVLSNLSSERAKSEIVGSKTEIENYIQTAVTTFAYPFGKEGDFTEENVSQIQDCGLKLACTAIRGKEFLPLENPYTLKRRAVEDTPYLFY